MLGIVVTGLNHGSLGKKREQLIENTVQVCIDHLKLNRFKGLIHVKQTKSTTDGLAYADLPQDMFDVLDPFLRVLRLALWRFLLMFLVLSVFTLRSALLPCLQK